MKQFVNDKTLDETIIKGLLYKTQLEKSLSPILSKLYERINQELESLFHKGIEQNNLFVSEEGLYEFYQVLKANYALFLRLYEDTKSDINEPHIIKLLEDIEGIFTQDLNNFLGRKDLAKIERDDYINRQETVTKNLLKRKMTEFKPFSYKGPSEIKSVMEAMEVYVEGSIEVLVSEAVAKMDITYSYVNNIDNRPGLKVNVDYLHQQDRAISLLNLYIKSVDNYNGNDSGEVYAIDMLKKQLQKIYDLLAAKLFEVDHNDTKVVAGAINEQTVSVLCNQLLKMAVAKLSKDQGVLNACEDYRSNNKELMDQLYISITDEIDKSRMQSILGFEKQSRPVQLASGKIVSMLESLVIKTQKLDTTDMSDVTSDKIVAGIAESIALKYNSLKSDDYNFVLERNSQLIEIEKTLYEFSESLKASFKGYYDQLMVEAEKSFYKVEKSFDQVINSHQRNLKKEDVSYLKHHLLFEVVTLEDILNQSLPRLRQSGNQEIETFILDIEETFNQIIGVLEAFMITPIIPEIGSRFNGKQHEVTLTESVDDYKRGQIIKCITRGYVFDGVTIIRAQVIVAK